MNKLNWKLVAFVGTVLTALSFPAIAGATSPDPTASVTTLAAAAVTGIFPIMIAVATAAIGIAVLWFGVRKVFQTIRSGGQVR